MPNRINTQQIIFRIPGDWAQPGDLLEHLPMGFEMVSDGLRLPNGNIIECYPKAPDGQFAKVFASACRRLPTETEKAIISRYKVNIVMIGSGGSMDAALEMMQAASAILKAGGAGVFIDNSALAHGARDWLSMTEDGGADAISFAYVSITRSGTEIKTMGMNTLGFPDLLMNAADLDDRAQQMIDIIRYLCKSQITIDVGHLLGDEIAAQFRVASSDKSEFPPTSIMHNPNGILRIISTRGIADAN